MRTCAMYNRLFYFPPLKRMETYWRKSIENGLRKERDPRIQRTVENVGTIPDYLFMKNHLDGLHENGKVRFCYMKTRKTLIQWRCEQSNHQTGSSAGDPETTRANPCSAYVSLPYQVEWSQDRSKGRS